VKERKTWEEFKAAGLLWWVNRGLHLFGWAIVVEEIPGGSIGEVYPARVAWRGFMVGDEVAGFRKLTHHIEENAAELRKEVDEDDG
jgi:hypothetical protein